MSRKSSKKNTSAAPAAPPSEDWSFVESVLRSPVARTVYLWGPPGVGKTFVAMRSRVDGGEVFVVTLTPETPASELRGFWVPSGEGFAFQEGVFIEAMRKGATLVINEIAYASHDVQAILHPVLESPETASLTLPTLETVRPAPGFQVICTDNLAPSQLPDALRDRFGCVLHVTRPHPEALARLPEDLREAALRTFDLEPERAVSVRGWLSVARFETEFGRENACRVVFGRERGEQIWNGLVLSGSGSLV